MKYNITISNCNNSDVLLQLFNSMLSNSSAIYLSGPITTGPRFFDWYVDKGYKLENDNITYQEDKRRNVLGPNESDIFKTAEALRLRFNQPLIEPASLHIINWTQNDYYCFWTEVMKRFISRMISIDGWQYSIGCVVEYHHAVHFGIPVENIQGDIITPERAYQQIFAAADDIEKKGAAFPVLLQMSQALRTKEILLGA
jgi:hypothetical protein